MFRVKPRRLVWFKVVCTFRVVAESVHSRQRRLSEVLVRVIDMASELTRAGIPVAMQVGMDFMQALLADSEQLAA